MAGLSVNKPRILITLGDVAGIGPEIVVKAWSKLVERAEPVVVGDGEWLDRAIELTGSQAKTVAADRPFLQPATSSTIPFVNPTSAPLDKVQVGKVSADAGRAAYDYLCFAIDCAMRREADAIVTCPLHKEGLHAAGVKHPGHTEILAERTATKEFAMVLWGDGIAVAHVTLHMSLRSVFDRLTTAGVLEKAQLLNSLLPKLLGRPPRVGIAALNPHAGDGGLFGDEEARIIAPAVRSAIAEGINASGPWPADTLFVRAHRGEFDGVVAMYHDEGHIAMKLRCGPRCVNITVGLPIVRTSVAHGTAYDIAGQGIADSQSLIEAADVASRLAGAAKVG